MPALPKTTRWDYDYLHGHAHAAQSGPHNLTLLGHTSLSVSWHLAGRNPNRQRQPGIKAQGLGRRDGPRED